MSDRFDSVHVLKEVADAHRTNEESEYQAPELLPVGATINLVQGYSTGWYYDGVYNRRYGYV